MVTAQGVTTVTAPARRAGESGSAYIRRLEIDGWLSAEAVLLRSAPRTGRSRWRSRPRAAARCTLPRGFRSPACGSLRSAPPRPRSVAFGRDTELCGGDLSPPTCTPPNRGRSLPWSGESFRGAGPRPFGLCRAHVDGPQSRPAP
jgi:hypothetical protein